MVPRGRGRAKGRAAARGAIIPLTNAMQCMGERQCVCVVGCVRDGGGFELLVWLKVVVVAITLYSTMMVVLSE